MSDLNKEALDVWGGLKPMIDQEISSRTQGMVQRRKAKVTTAPSLATNTIGVTEAFGDEMFLPFVTNMISAKVGDFVWIEWMYGATNAFVSSYAAVDDKNVSVAGVLDVVQRRCFATLASQGWYRVLKLEGQNFALGGTSFEIDFVVGRDYWATSNEIHSIKLQCVANQYIFSNESSASNIVLVDKIRYIRETNNVGYVDIHYTSSASNEVYVGFTVYNKRQDLFVAMGLTSAPDSPSALTIREYTFAAKTNAELTVTYVSNSYVDSAAVGRLHFWIRGDVIVCLFNLGQVSAMATGTDFVKIGSVSFPRSLPVGFYATIPAQNGSGTLLVQIAANGDISIANASGATASGFYRSTFSFVMV